MPRSVPWIVLAGFAAAAAALAAAADDGAGGNAAARREAWVTLVVSEKYVVGALVLGQSLRDSNTTRPLVALVTEISARARAALTQVGFSLVDVEPIANPYTSRPLQVNNLTKLRVWDLTQFAVVVYLDADTVVLSNIDELFGALDDGSADRIAAAPDFPPVIFNAGVFVARPSADVFAALRAAVGKLPSENNGDQGFLNSFFAGDRWQWLSPVYNTLKTFKEIHLRRWTAWYAEQIKVLHYVRGKPWNFARDDPTQAMYTAEHARWWDAFERLPPAIRDDYRSRLPYGPGVGLNEG